VKLRLVAVLALLQAGIMIGGQHASAARSAVVDSDKAELREGPGEKFKVVDKLPKGTPLAASNQSIEGYFKVRTASGAIGFVSADALILEAPAAPPDESGTQDLLAPPPKAPGAPPSPPPSPFSRRERVGSKKHVRVKVFGGYDFFSVNDVNTLLQATLLQFGFSAGGELSYLVTPNLAIVLRGERIFKSAIARDLKSLQGYQMDVSSLPVMLGAELTLSKTRSFSSHVTVMGGLGLSTKLQATSVDDVAPNVTTVTAQPITAVGKLDFTYFFDDVWSLFFEGGYRYLKTSQLTPADSPNGSQIFKDPNTSAFVPVALDLSGPFVGLGLAITL
jgi:hypothetical protein